MGQGQPLSLSLKILILMWLSISTTTAIATNENQLKLPTTTTTRGEEEEEVYELLPKYGLPEGLLPNSVTNYTLSESDGRFVVVLAAPCYVQFDYLVYYEKTISGKLSYGSITELKGIQVQRFFLWFDVDEIKVDLPPSDSIYFQVGVINKRLDIEQFKTVHSCDKSKSKSKSETKSLLLHLLISEEGIM